MSLVTINEVGEPRSYQVKDGSTLIAYPLQFKGQMMEGSGELSQKPETAAPTVGLELDLEVLAPTAPGRPARLKKVKAAYDPTKSPATGLGPKPAGLPIPDSREASIIRQHSQHMAILWWATLQKESEALDTKGNRPEALRKIIDWFDDDVRQATKPL